MSAVNNKSLAIGWISSWQIKDFEWLRQHLSKDFQHSSPFGVLSGREHYLSIVAPLANKSVNKLVIKQVVVENENAAIWFENHGSDGITPTCDWLTISNGKITAIQSFYDASIIKKDLTSEEQNRLSDE